MYILSCAFDHSTCTLYESDWNYEVKSVFSKEYSSQVISWVSKILFSVYYEGPFFSLTRWPNGRRKVKLVSLRSSYFYHTHTPTLLSLDVFVWTLLLLEVQTFIFLYYHSPTLGDRVPLTGGDTNRSCSYETLCWSWFEGPSSLLDPGLVTILIL